MRLTHKAGLWATIPPSLLLAFDACSQDFNDVQAMANRALFAVRDVADQKQVAERRRIEKLDERTQQQFVVLQQQASTMSELASELQSIRDERRIIDLAADFDAAIVSRRWAVVRSLLAQDVKIELEGLSEPGTSPVPADSFISGLSKSIKGGAVLPRSNQLVRIESERAALTSDGYSWVQSTGSNGSLSRPFGRFEYSFRQTPEDWKIDGISFRPATPSPSNAS